MAYSENSSISREKINSEEFSLWKEFSSEEINHHTEYAESNKSRWDSYLNLDQNIMLRTSSNTDKKLSPNMIKLLEISLLEEVSPLVSSQWSQRNPFNEFCPNLYPAGCVAIAIGQIMNYHKKPEKSNNINWNWDNINDKKSPETGKFIKYIGDGVEMQYGKNGSHPKVVLSLKDRYKRELQFLRNGGYSAEDFDFNKSIKNKGVEELKQKRPFMISVFKGEIFMLIPTIGHMWVVDGYQLYQEKEIIPPEVPLDLSKMSDEEYVEKFWTGRYTKYYYLHFNWGWNGKDDGWYYGGLPHDKDGDLQKNKNY